MKWQKVKETSSGRKYVVHRRKIIYLDDWDFCEKGQDVFYKPISRFYSYRVEIDSFDKFARVTIVNT